MNKIIKKIIAGALCLTTIFTVAACQTRKIEDSDEIGKPTFDEELTIQIGTIAQVTLEDSLYDYISDKFNVNIEYTMLDYNMWNEQFNGMMNGGDMIDCVQWDMRPHLAATYQNWIAGEMIKPLPSSLTYFPNIKASLDKMPATKYMLGKNDQKLYCLPLMHGTDTTENGLLISDMHYVYRRDWAIQAGLYKEGDVYTFAEMEALLRAFANRGSNVKPFADVSWGIGSLANYYTTETGNYVYDEASGNYIWKLNDSKYVQGLDYVKNLKAQSLYNIDFYNDSESDLFNDYKGNSIGIYYNNFTLNNLSNLRDALKSSNPTMNTEAIRNATAPFYLVDGEGKIANEGMDNWWSSMLFNSTLSNAKMTRILAIMDWLLSEEGLYTCAYGIKDTDWSMDENGKVSILWDKDGNGDYIKKSIGSQKLRWMVSTCNDMDLLNPLISKQTKEDYLAYRTKMNTLHSENKIHYVTINRDLQWLSAANKDNFVGTLRTGSITAVTKYINGQSDALTKYYDTNKKNIDKVLAEINSAL